MKVVRAGSSSRSLLHTGTFGVRSNFERGRIVAYLVVQALWLDNVVIDDFDLKPTIRWGGQMFDQLPQLWPSYTVCTVDSDRSIELLASHRSFERGRCFLIVSLLGRFAILIRGALGVQATGDVVELRCGQ